MLTPSQTERVLRIAQAQAQAQQVAQVFQLAMPQKFFNRFLLIGKLFGKQAHAQQRAYSNPTRSQMQHTVIGRQPYNSYNPLPMGQIGAQQPQQPPPLVRAQPQNHM